MVGFAIHVLISEVWRIGRFCIISVCEILIILKQLDT